MQSTFVLQMKNKKNIVYIFTTLFGLLFQFNCFAQKKFNDSVYLNELVVTATRTTKSIGDIPVPVQVINKRFIQQTGSQKLIDILQQQAGLVLADNPLGQALQGYPNPFGSGIQLQGLDPAYTLILLDGEPLTGRNAGILNMGRIAIGNIKQVEIVKGPATSLYGSDALAGVINIITDKPTTNNTSLQLHHATNNTNGITLTKTFITKKTGIQLFANRYSSNGYDLDKDVFGKTADPFHNYSFSAKGDFKLSAKTLLTAAARVFTQKQFNNYLIYTNAQPDEVKGSSNETDWSINTQLHQTLSAKAKLIARLYATGYKDNANVYLQKNNTLYDNAFMQQQLLKPELQMEWGADKNQLLITGAGYNYETIFANRYASKKYLHAVYAFIQKEWLPFPKLNITAGARLDKNTLYSTQLNPKLAVAYKASDKITFNASAGNGFKAPDFRQQFLYFTNSLIGYTLLGAEELNNGLRDLKRTGQIDAAIDINPYLVNHTLVPEKSTGINTGARYGSRNTTITADLFRNDISHLIDRYNLPFSKINNQAIYSYVNINRVFTQGLTISVQHSVSNAFSIQTNYQYLDAKDKTILEKINNREIVKRDPVTYVSNYVTKKEYGGLFNRSKHSASAMIRYSNKHHWLNANIRAVYRSRFGYSDINGNAILDDSREYTNGYILFNTTISASLKKGFQLQTGCENLLNHTDKIKLPGLSGRIFFINCTLDFDKLINKNKNTIHK